MSTLILGKKGEDLACAYLIQRGHTIKETNWRFRKFEIDIISETPDFVHFIEVKTRKEDGLQNPLEAVTRKKQHFLLQAADQYLKSKGLEKEARMDVIAITHNSLHPKFDYVPDAFSS